MHHGDVSGGEGWVTMRIGLCMIVKDEANRIAGALDGVIDLFDQVTVIDTGSTDGTLDILRQRYGVEPLTSRLDEGDCFCKSDLPPLERSKS